MLFPPLQRVFAGQGGRTHDLPERYTSLNHFINFGVASVKLRRQAHRFN